MSVKYGILTSYFLDLRTGTSTIRRTKIYKPVYRAQALVEFALILPVLLILTMLIIQYGIIFLTINVLTNLSREGPRYAAAAPTSDTATKQRVQDVTPSNINYSDVNVSFDPVDESSTARQPGS